MRVIGIIPARYASSRFPGKPLADIQGKSMIQRVYEQAAKVPSLSEVVVATDDERIRAHVANWGGKVMMTASTHRSGTERCAEVAAAFTPKADIVVNIQGDEPFIQPEQIQSLIEVFEENKEVEIASLAKAITAEEELLSPNVVKVVMDTNKRALYFSRSVIPFMRDQNNKKALETSLFHKHIGLYAYTSKALANISKLPTHTLEQAESLEQLRWLANGYRIQMAITTHQAISVDTPEDLAYLIQKIKI